MDIQNMSWVEDTKNEVDFLIDQLKLQGNEKILDLACGYGRHSLELARRGYDVTGIDITSEYIVEILSDCTQYRKYRRSFRS